MNFWVWGLVIFIGLFAIYLAVLIYNQKTYILRAPEKGEPIDTGSEVNQALLVIDIQNVPPFANPKQLARVPEAGRLIDTLNATIDRFKSQDRDVLFIAQVKEAKSARSFFMPHIPVRGSKTAEVNSGLHIGDAPVFTKLRADAFSNPELQRYLAERKIGELVITGIAAEVCVHYTIQGALNRGYRVSAVRDAIYAIFGESSKAKMIEKYQQLGAEVITSNDLVAV